MNFRLGQPFRPYQQLMGVLPDRSKRIVPMPYHDLMTNADSPIIDFYPRDFELDMNGKKMEWEAVVKIPFIDEERLLPAMKTKDYLLSQAEKDRNEFGVTLKFSYAPEVDFTFPTSLVGIFPDLPHCHCIENIFDLPTIEGLDFYVGLMDGVKLGESALAGFPSLKTLPHTGGLGFHSVNVFQQDSRNESMVVTMLDPEKRSKVESAKSRLGHSVHVGYPFLSEARIVRVSDELFNYSLAHGGSGLPVAIPHGPQEIDMWRRKAERIESSYSKRLGMIIGPVESLVHVEMLKGLKKTDEGATIKEYAQIPGIEVDYASQMVVGEVVSKDQRFIEKAALPIEEEFPIGTRAFFLGDFNYGRPLQVEGHIGNKIVVWVSTINGTSEFGREIAANAERHSPYTPSFAVARALGLNPLVLSKITSAFQVELDDSRVNLGLNLKFEAKKLKVLGYSRRGQTGWEFSEKAISLLQQYMVKFPGFIAGIQRNPQGNTYEATDFFPKEEASSKIKEIQAWLRSVESKSFQKVPLEAAQLDSEVVNKIEKAADDVVVDDPPKRAKNRKINGVPRNALLKPSDAEHRLGSQTFDLGDRIVYVQDSGRVPIATQGTVVGMTRTARTTLLDVVFDLTFMSGTTLEDRCSPFRGSTVPTHSVLNITSRQLISGSRAAEMHRPQPVEQSSMVSGYGAPMGPNGRGQLLPAQAPGPLQGSFRGALGVQENGLRTRGGGRAGLGLNGMQAGQHQNLPIRNSLVPRGGGFVGGADHTNGSRGRGGQGNSTGERGGHMNGARSHGRVSPSNNSAEVRPASSYSNMPPPTNLESRSRGRGRGGFRGVANGRDASRGRGRGFSGSRGTVAVQQQ